jgi:hypothetical protein
VFAENPRGQAYQDKNGDLTALLIEGSILRYFSLHNNKTNHGTKNR